MALLPRGHKPTANNASSAERRPKLYSRRAEADPNTMDGHPRAAISKPLGASEAKPCTHADKAEPEGTTDNASRSLSARKRLDVATTLADAGPALGSLTRGANDEQAPAVTREALDGECGSSADAIISSTGSDERTTAGGAACNTGGGFAGQPIFREPTHMRQRRGRVLHAQRPLEEQQCSTGSGGLVPLNAGTSTVSQLTCASKAPDTAERDCTPAARGQDSMALDTHAKVACAAVIAADEPSADPATGTICKVVTGSGWGLTPDQQQAHDQTPGESLQRIVAEAKHDRMNTLKELQVCHFALTWFWTCISRYTRAGPHDRCMLVSIRSLFMGGVPCR